MGEFFRFMVAFFRGWRRKIGVVTLAIGLAAMSVWVYSFNGDSMFDFDHYHEMQVGPGSSGFNSIGIYQSALEFRKTWSTHRRVSNIQNVDPATLASYVKMTVTYEKGYEKMSQFFDGWDQSSVTGSPTPTSLEMPDPEEEALAVHGNSTIRKHSETMYYETIWNLKKVFSIPLWSVAIPLTLLSSWLLLSKPRLAKPKQAIFATVPD